MGVDYDPEIVYGFRVRNVRIYDEGIGWSIPESFRHMGSDHFFGPEVSFRQYKRRQIPEDITRFGTLMLKHFGIRCHYFMGLSGDVCDHCDEVTINFLDFVRLMKPEWTKEECLKLVREFCKFKYEDDDEDDREFEGKVRELKYKGSTPPFHVYNDSDLTDVEEEPKPLDEEVEDNEEEANQEEKVEEDADHPEGDEDDKVSKKQRID